MYRAYSKDKFLYHYTKTDILSKNILPTMSLRFSPYSKTNDPYETKSWSLRINNSSDIIVKSEGKEKIVNASIIGDFNFEREAIIHEIKSNFKSLCFTKDRGDGYEYNSSSSFKKGWGYPRMWAQYGEDHNGVCLMFDHQILSEIIFSELSDEFEVFFENVEYTDELIENNSNKIDFLEVKKKGISDSIESHINNNIEEFFFKKACDWRDERESRYLIYPQCKVVKEEFIYIPIEKALKVIVLGAKVDVTKIEPIEDMAKAKKIPIYKVDWGLSFPMIHNNDFSWCNDLSNPF